ncbi:MAG: glycerol-3-phosphate 1-O-acyltransferase PlsY [Verrucomicrobiota bacterium]
MDIIQYLATALVAYLIGSIPTGYLVAKMKGIDIRSVGSGNIGATNVFRILGKTAGIGVLLVDALKGFVACRMIAFGSGPAEYHAIIAGIAAILGHNYTVWLYFKGGKGIATSAGVLLALVPLALAIVLSIWILLFFTTRYVSVASIAAAFFLPFAAWLAGNSTEIIGVTAAMGALAIYKHKSNIRRLLDGTENRIQFKKPSASAT